MKKINFIWIMFLLLTVSIASAEVQTLGTFKQDECVNLVQICSNCTYNNISAVLYPDSLVAVSSKAMSTSDYYYYNYTFCNTSKIGEYIVNGYGDLDGIATVWSYNFYVNYNGKVKNSEGTLAVTVFLLLSTGVLFVLSMWRNPFVNDEIADYILKKCFLIIAVFLMTLNSAIIASIAEASGLDILSELFTYTWIFSWGGYILMAVLVLTTLFKTMNLWNQKKRMKRVGY